MVGMRCHDCQLEYISDHYYRVWPQSERERPDLLEVLEAPGLENMFVTESQRVENASIFFSSKSLESASYL